jgi:glycosyltransferase involved in cell wall biosynthesis
MDLGYFTTKFPYENHVNGYVCGGSVLATYYLVLEMAKNNNIKVFTTSADKNDSRELFNNLIIYRYATNLKIMTSNISSGLFYKPLSHNLDLIHVSFDMPPGPFASLRYVNKKNVPFVLTYHGDWEDSYGSIFRRSGVSFYNKFVNKILSKADVIISPSESYIHSSKFLKKHQEKIKIIPNGIKIEEFELSYSKEYCRLKLDLPPDKDILLFFGYLSPYKSPDNLIRAFKNVIKKNPNTFLLFAGSGIMMDELKRLSISLKIEDKVRFDGFVGKDLRPYYYKAADLFCLPSTLSTECHPLSILESMASGTPVIASRIGGIPDIINDYVNGILVEPGNVINLSNSILSVLNDNLLKRRMEINCKKIIKDYTWTNISEMTEQVYKDVIN